jgi:hypothetical protein
MGKGGTGLPGKNRPADFQPACEHLGETLFSILIWSAKT